MKNDILANIEISKSPQRLQIAIKSFNILIYFALLGIPLDSYAIVRFSERFPFPDIRLIIFILLQVILGFCLTWLALRWRFAKTLINIDAEGMTIKNKPIPQGTDKKFPAGTFKLLYYERFVIDVRYGRSGSIHEGYVSHEIHAMTHDNEPIVLITELKSKEQAMFLIREIGEFLGIDYESAKSKSNLTGQPTEIKNLS